MWDPTLHFYLLRIRIQLNISSLYLKSVEFLLFKVSNYSIFGCVEHFFILKIAVLYNIFMPQSIGGNCNWFELSWSKVKIKTVISEVHFCRDHTIDEQDDKKFASERNSNSDILFAVFQ